MANSGRDLQPGGDRPQERGLQQGRNLQEEVERVAETARIGLRDGEWETFASDLELIETAAKRLAELPLDGVEPTLFPLPLTNVMRTDEARPSLSQEDALANAPEAEEGCFWVPRILDM